MKNPRREKPRTEEKRNLLYLKIDTRGESCERLHPKTIYIYIYIYMHESN